MTDDLNSVKTESAKERGYHHGALRTALIEAAESVIAERGVDRFSLREVARRAGVSPAAPAHHFGDSRGLLTAVAAAAFRRFGDALAASDAGGSREQRIRAQGLAYVRFALAERARFDLMWRYALIDRDNADYKAAADRAFLLLDELVRGPGAPRGESDLDYAPSIACWSMVHGFARLALDGAFGDDSAIADAAVAQLLPRVLDHLDV